MLVTVVELAVVVVVLQNTVVVVVVVVVGTSSSSCMHVTNHNWSAMKQHLQSSSAEFS